MGSIAAPAKLNLYLHVLSRCDDGYHEIETSVVFTALSDRLSVALAETLSLTVSGQFAADAGPVESNLIMKAAHLLQQKAGKTLGAALHVEKNIPAGAGLGGGSSDAAAALRLLNDFWELHLHDKQLHELAAQLGADVAMFLAGKPLVARGIGDKITLLNKPLPPLHAVLVYPGKPLLTAQVYALLTEDILSRGSIQRSDASIESWVASLPETGGSRNDLQRAAVAALPEVAEALLALETTVPRSPFVRMSGSGSCCYALYRDADHAAACAGVIRERYPHWWVMATTLLC